MVKVSPEDRELASRLLEYEASEQTANPFARSPDAAARPVPIAVVGEGILQRLTTHLTNWFGIDGVDALLVRALDSTRTEFPFLSAIEHPAPGILRLGGLDSGASDGSPHRAPIADPVALAEGLVAIIATVIALLGRLIGADMAHRLVERCCSEPQRGEAGARSSLNMEEVP